jgi:hypothetical protein
MQRVVGMVTVGRTIVWQNTTGLGFGDEEDGISVGFNRYGPLLRRRGKSDLQKILEENKTTWIWQRGDNWFVNLDQLRERFDWTIQEDWATGIAVVKPAQRDSDGGGLFVEFVVYKEDYIVDRRRKIFLSHKGVDKALVGEYFTVLKTLGFEPWLDKEAMTAGAKLDRAILQGMQDSCAAVFFITPHFVDDKYLSDEIEHAIREQREKGDKFRIISLVYTHKKKTGVVPELLKKFLFLNPKSDLEAIDMILKALPIEVGPPDWKAQFSQPDHVDGA